MLLKKHAQSKCLESSLINQEIHGLQQLLIFLYKYIAYFQEMTPWCIDWFVYVGIKNS
jgi:hypothetical protein